MSALLPALVIAQAALLLWSAISFGHIFLGPKKIGPALLFIVTLGLALALPRWNGQPDPDRFLCSALDCVVLVLIVGFVKVWASNRENVRLVLERQLAKQAAADALVAARREYQEARIRSATAALEARHARLSRGAAPSPKLPPKS